MEEKEYQFERVCRCIEFGIVTASSEEEAREKILNDEYDDVFDSSVEESDEDIIELREVK